MRIFLLPEFSRPEYRETLFAKLQVVDLRNPELIDCDPIPHAARIMAFRVAARFSTWLVSKLDGSPDYRYKDNVAGGGGDQWTLFSQLVETLVESKSRGDIFRQNKEYMFPIAASQISRDGKSINAAILIGLQGWALPLYFDGEFDLFADAVVRLMDLQSEIASGVAPRVDVHLDAQTSV